jgi:hypothetical protein
MAVPFINGGKRIPPSSAWQSDTHGDECLPLGARIRLDPALDISAGSPEAQAIGRALKFYGAYIVDVSRTPVIYLEDREHCASKWWFNQSILQAIPMSAWRRADWRAR